MFTRIRKISLPAIFFLTYICLLADACKYSGFVRNHFLIDPLILVGISILLAILQSGRKNYIHKINCFVLPVTFIIYLIMEFFEAKFYPNYVFSHLHIQPQYFFNIVLFSGMLFFINNIKFDKYVRKSKYDIGQLATLLLFVAFIVAFTDSVSKTLNLAINSDFYMLDHLSYNYDNKMRERWGSYYDYMKFVRDNTQENSRILIPPQAYYGSTGNAGLDRYFLYPRRLVNGELNNVSVKGYDYVLMNPGWPKEVIKTDNILIFNSDGSIAQYKNIYDPEKINDSWGIIKLTQ